jgi:hypothetical protein
MHTICRAHRCLLLVPVQGALQSTYFTLYSYRPYKNEYRELLRSPPDRKVRVKFPPAYYYLVRGTCVLIIKFGGRATLV